MIEVKIPGTFVEATIEGRRIRFFVHNPADVIQRHHLAGEFYEPEELALMSRHMTATSRYLDVGANVGNHIIYLCKFIGLKHIVPVEPNGPAMAILRLNVALNGLQEVVDLSCLGYGLSDRASRGEMYTISDNLGQARFEEDPAGSFQFVTGDALLGERDFDFIKIDTEGMEIRCLNGLEQLVGRCRPKMLVEVDDTNQSAFLDWCAAHDYAVRDILRRYTHNANYFVAPSSQGVTAT